MRERIEIVKSILVEPIDLTIKHINGKSSLELLENFKARKTLTSLDEKYLAEITGMLSSHHKKATLIKEATSLPNEIINIINAYELPSPTNNISLKK